MSKQTEAERLADALERQFPTGTAQGHLDGEAAAELRRLVSFNQQLMDEVARLNKAVADEREQCAKVCDSEKKWWNGMSNSEKDIYQAIDNVSARIRARGNT